jgi:transcriptional regulator with XRE-family HTH domain
MSMRELARRSSLSAAQVSRIESGGVTPSIETLAKLALALERQPEPLYIAAGYADLSESLELVRGMLTALPSGAALDLAGALQELGELEAETDRLEAERQACWQASRAELGCVLDLQADLKLVEDQANQAAVREHESDDPDEVAQLRGETALEAAVGRDLFVAEEASEEADNRLLEAETRAAIAQEALERRVREVAARLFLLTGRERLARVSAVTNSSAAHRAEASARLGAMRNLTDWVEQDLSTTSPAQVDRDLRTVVRAWLELTSDRRRRVLAYVEDQRQLSAHEVGSKTTRKGGENAMPDEDEPE